MCDTKKNKIYDEHFEAFCSNENEGDCWEFWRKGMPGTIGVVLPENE